MPIDRTRLPHGVTVPASLDETDARAVIDTLAHHYGWGYVLLGRPDVDQQLGRSPGTAPGGRRLTADEWQRVRATAAWTTLPTTVQRVVADKDVIAAAIRQAVLECVDCAAPLTGPPTATWGHCPTCLSRANLDDLRRRPCPATGADEPHHWGDTACRACGIPCADAAPANGERRLTAVRSAA